MLSFPKHLACAETSASNTNEASLYELRGLTAWVNAMQFGAGNAGGDVHRLSQLTEALHAFRGGADPLDDQTIIVLRREPPGNTNVQWIRLASSGLNSQSA